MSDHQWTAVDAYLTDLLALSDDVLEGALAASNAAGLPEIQVSPPQGKLLSLLARICGARRILELGTLGGYSTLWLARALPANGRLVTIEYEPAHATVARENFRRAGLDEMIELLVGPALERLPELSQRAEAPFDLIFIDADKENYPAYLPWALRLSRPGSLIIADNVIRNGAVADSGSTDPRVQAVRRYLELVAAEPRLSATALQTVGCKGYDGFSVALVTS